MNLKEKIILGAAVLIGIGVVAWSVSRPPPEPLLPVVVQACRHILLQAAPRVAGHPYDWRQLRDAQGHDLVDIQIAAGTPLHTKAACRFELGSVNAFADRLAIAGPLGNRVLKAGSTELMLYSAKASLARARGE